MAPMENVAPGSYHYPMDHHHNQFQPPQWNQPPLPQWNHHPPHPGAPVNPYLQNQQQPQQQHYPEPSVAFPGVDSNSNNINNNNMKAPEVQPSAQPKQPLAQTRVNVQDQSAAPAASTASAAAPQSFDVLKSPTTRVFESMLTAADSIATPATAQAKKGSKKKSAAKKQKLSPPQQQATAEMPLPLNADGTENPFALIQRDPMLYKKVVLCMALQRQPKEVKDEPEGPPPVISEGFYWKDYPPCETVLYESMSEYYELSKQSRQSKEQQAFNNDLVRRIRATAEQQGYVFDDNYFTDKRLRDRIRCFFKTHLQNGKKRLMTMQKHPESLENQQVLHGLIQQARNRMAEEEVHEEQEQLVQQVVQETHDALLPSVLDDSLLPPEFTFSDEHDSLLPPADADDYEIDGKKRRRSSLSSSANIDH